MRHLLAIFLLFLTLGVYGQKVRFEADCNATDVVLGNAFRISFRLENDEITNIEFPEFERAGFQVMQGPVNEKQYQYINGKSSSVEAFSFVLAPNHTGKLSIGPATVKTRRGKTLRSKAIGINCVKPNNKSIQEKNTHNLPSSLKGKIFFRVEPDRRQAVVGEQLTLDFKVYTQVDISNIELMKDPAFDDSYTYPLRFYNKEPRIEVLNGRQYAAKTIYSLAVFPSKEGELEVGPAQLRIALGSDPFNPFAKSVEYPIASSPFTIKVESLTGKHDNFSGAVGEFDVQMHLDNPSISTDDVIRLTLRIQGKGDIKQILGPDILKGDKNFDSYEPKMKEDIQEGRAGIGGTKIFEYTLTPQKIGDVSISPSFTYYDTRQRRFITYDTSMQVKVVQGKRKVGEAALAAMAAVDSTEKKEIINFYEPLENATWTKENQPFIGTIRFWIYSLLPLLLFGVLVFWHQFKEQQRLRRIRYLERTKAERLSKEGLILANTHLADGNSHQFYETIGQTIKTYLSIKLDIGLAEINQEKIMQQLKNLQVDKTHLQDLEAILKSSEEAVFAAQNNAATMREVQKKTEKLIKIFNKILPKHAATTSEI